MTIQLDKVVEEQVKELRKQSYLVDKKQSDDKKYLLALIDATYKQMKK